MTSDEPFRWRGKDVSRVEAISDAVFGFAVTLIVVSLDVPKTFDQLLHDLAGVPAFACAFAILALIWFKQYRFFRRFGLDDTKTTVLNFALLFVLLVYVYPLKFLFAGLFGANPALYHEMGAAQFAELFGIYSAGYIAQQAIFVALYRHALRFAQKLELAPAEIDGIHLEVAISLAASACAAIVPIAALFLPVPWSGMAGFFYFSIIPATRFVAARHRLAGKGRFLSGS